MLMKWHSNVWVWLNSEVQRPKIEVCSTPESGHFEAHAGLPLLTRNGHLGVRSANQLEPKISDSRIFELVVRLKAQSFRYEESLDQYQIGGYKAVCHPVALDLAFDLNAN